MLDINNIEHTGLVVLPREFGFGVATVLGERKYFLDWLRFLAFVLLIIFHTGLMYVDWSYVFKSPRLVPELEWVLLVFYPWRIVLIFFISGVASRFLIEKHGSLSFVKDRLIRILPVLFFGTLIINPTQNYLEVMTEGKFSGGYLEFWINHYLVGDITMGKIFPTWDHLWFLAYLLVYILVAAVLFPIARSWIEAIGTRQHVATTILFLGCAWLAISNVIVSEFQPATFDLVNDWGVHLRSVGVFSVGFVYAGNPHFWSSLRSQRKRLALCALALLSVMLIIRAAPAAFASVVLNVSPDAERVAYVAISGVYA